jgi:hypothetical protein
MHAFVTPASLLAIVLLLGPVSAGAVTVSVQPADTTVTVGDTLTLRVTADAFADLKGYQLVHGFDPTRLASIGVLAGDVLTGAGGSYVAFPLPDAAAPQDSTWLDAAMLDGSTSTPGVLEYLVFVATAKGDAVVTCEHAELRDSQNAWTYPGCAGGVVHIVGPTPVRRPTWGGLKAAYH